VPKLTIDGHEIEVPAGTTILQACELTGAEVPRFCYHERLSIAGNCRMCLVEMEKSPKPIASCAMPAADGMVIRTDSALVRDARRGVMEFLLINHPLDCPICDQGGECDLQDQAMGYGYEGSRFEENKRAVTDKHMGPLIKTIMTRCIHCTRCVRFAAEVAGVDDLGLLGRSEGVEITTYLEKSLDSELSGNVIDLCPVGALTSKPYAFAARSWELEKTESIDVMDAVGSNIRVDVRGRDVLRVLPRLHEDINEEWISDKTRFACDGLRRQRLDRPFVRNAKGQLEEADWDYAIAAIAMRIKGIEGQQIAALAGNQCDAESIFALKQLMEILGSPNLDCRQDGAAIDPSLRAGYLFNTTIAGIEEADTCLLIGSNPRFEAPLINARIRKRWLTGELSVAQIGPKIDLTYTVDTLGTGPQTLQEIVDGTHSFTKTLRKANRPMLVLGQGAISRPDGAAILSVAHRISEEFGLIREDWNGFNMLHTSAARVGALDLGFVPAEGGLDTAGILNATLNGAIEVIYLLGADEIDMSRLGDAFVIYQGHHGDAGAHRADVVLPGSAYTEKNGTYVNTEGRVQIGRRAVFPPGDAREDWSIIRAISDALGKPLNYNDLQELRLEMREYCPTFSVIDSIEEQPWGAFGTTGNMSEDPFVLPVSNFYMTDPISRSSETMAKCTNAFVSESKEATVTHG